MSNRELFHFFGLLGVLLLALLVPYVPLITSTPAMMAGGVVVLAACAWVLLTGLWVSVNKHTNPDEVSRLVLPGIWLAVAVDAAGQKSCGCVYKYYVSGFRTREDRYAPESEPATEFDDADADAEVVWVRSEDGAKATFRRYVERMKRCTRCGDYHYEYDREPADYEPTIWVDDPLPDEIADGNGRVVDSDIVEVDA